MQHHLLDDMLLKPERCSSVFGRSSVDAVLPPFR